MEPIGRSFQRAQKMSLKDMWLEVTESVSSPGRRNAASSLKKTIDRTMRYISDIKQQLEIKRIWLQS